jgi:hypothetical protein
MFTSHILQREKTRTVVLIHGLFTTSGFWLPALRCFPQHRIVLINVDYRSYLETENALPLLDEFINQPELRIRGDIDLIGHSFGSVLTATLPLPTVRRYHMCPVFLAQRTSYDELLVELSGRLGSNVPPRELALGQMRRAVSISQSVDYEKMIMRGDRCLIPDNDRFFSYRNPPSRMTHTYYHGDHFNVVEPLSSLFESDYAEY